MDFILKATPEKYPSLTLLIIITKNNLSDSFIFDFYSHKKNNNTVRSFEKYFGNTWNDKYAVIITTNYLKYSGIV